MTVTTGTRVGQYQITSQIGAGGMVYRARDTKLDRDVALKILPESFRSDPDRLMRFEREAKTLASLNHPNIAAIYGIESDALVMELVEGEDLSELIARGRAPGAIDLADALPIAKQIADALEAAHEAGIVHRDLKPANIKVRSDGVVKVLDFGLAKATGPSEGDGFSRRQVEAEASALQTITTPAMPFDWRSGHPEQGRGVTQAGIILGTAAYMAPEQARGKAVDKRADIWAFGCVLSAARTEIVPGAVVLSPGHSWLVPVLAFALVVTLIGLAAALVRQDGRSDGAPLRLAIAFDGSVPQPMPSLALSPDGTTLVYTAGGGPEGTQALAPPPERVRVDADCRDGCVPEDSQRLRSHRAPGVLLAGWQVDRVRRRQPHQEDPLDARARDRRVRSFRGRPRRHMDRRERDRLRDLVWKDRTLARVGRWRHACARGRRRLSLS